MVRSRRSTTSIKDDGSASIADSGISLLSPLSAAPATPQSPHNANATDSAPRKQHNCHVCGKTFRGSTDLKRHLLIHSDERPHKCTQCSKCFRQAVNLKNHITTAHEQRKQFVCTQCNKSFALKERLRLHMRLHSGEKPYACMLCDKRFARGGQLQQHIVSHHRTSLQQFNCTQCSASFSTNVNLRAHMERHRQETSSETEQNCMSCDQVFPNADELNTHVSFTHCKRSADEPAASASSSSSSTASSSPGSTACSANTQKSLAAAKRYVCDVCGSSFTQKSQCNVHMRMHTGERPYQCRICQQTFTHSSVLKVHIRKHTGEKPFPCPLCVQQDVAFTQLPHLKMHLRKIHKQNRPYMCAGCHEFWKLKAELEAHMPTCERYNVVKREHDDTLADEPALTALRLNIAIILRRISSTVKLRQLRYGRRLIDNVLIAALKLAKRRVHANEALRPIENLRLNVQEFFEWVVPAEALRQLRASAQNVDTILEKLADKYCQRSD